MNVGFCSDLHLGHDLAAELRGFKSVAEHDHTIIAMLQMQCNKRTVLWVLGDVAMRMESMQLLADVPGRKKLVRGNHDKLQMGAYLKYFEEIHGIIRYDEMWLTHCPVHPQEVFRRGVCYNVHGHIHDKANTGPLKFPPYINVNWDFWGRAVSLDEIRSIKAGEMGLPYVTPE
jgi:calcineurin-like phosphoesterase family protein